MRYRITMRVLGVVLAAAWLAAGCGDSDGGTGTGITVTAEPAGANCPDGGHAVDFGNGGGTTYVCNGEEGADAILSVTAEPAGTDCANGGVAIVTGSGTSYVCAGEDGEGGTNGASVTVTVESAGSNCANGGFRLDSTSGTAFVCHGEDGTNGTNGTSVTVTPEGAGPNCLYGGYRLDSASGTSFVCHGHPGGDGPCVVDENWGMNFYLNIPTITGSVTQSGREGHTIGLAVCYDVATAYDPATGQPAGLPIHSPFRVVIPRNDMALATFHQALTTSTAIPDVTVEAWAAAPSGQEVMHHTWELSNAYVVGLYQYLGPPQRDHVLEMALSFDSITVTYLDGGITTTAASPMFALPPLRHDECEPSSGLLSTYVTITNPTILGDVTDSGREDTIRTLGVCHGRVNPFAPSDGQPAGPKEQTPVTLLKTFDRSSPLLLDALLNGTTLGSVQIDHWRVSKTGPEEQHLTMTLTNAQVVRVEEADVPPSGQAHSRWERVSLTYESIEWDWKLDSPDVATFTDTW